MALLVTLVARGRLEFTTLRCVCGPRVPIIILNTEDKINDLKRFCCPPHAAQSTVLGINKNL